jgi:magnesium-transporting ATPase (P-type)
LEEKLIKKIERKINMIGAIGVEESVTFKAKETLSVMKDKGIKPWLITH